MLYPRRFIRTYAIFHFHLAEIMRIFSSSVALPETKTSRNLSGNLKRKLVLLLINGCECHNARRDADDF